MTASTESRAHLTLVEQQIVAALAELRAARLAVARTGTVRSIGRASRAEEELNALLDYRLAIRGR